MKLLCYFEKAHKQLGLVVERLEPLLAITLDRYRGRAFGGEFHFYLHGQMIFLESESINK